MMARAGAIILAALPAVALAEPHAHGMARADVAVDGTEVHIEMRIPAADVLGFEHEARSDAQKARVVEARAMFEAPDRVVALNDKAGCTIRVAAIEIGPEAAAEDHDDHGHDAAHADDAHDDHAADEHADDHAEAHSEIHAHYIADCARPGALAAISFPYFQQDIATATIAVRALSATGAVAGELSASDPEMSLSPLSGS